MPADTRMSLFTRPQRRHPSPEYWRKRYTKADPRGPGIPATHIDEIPNSSRKVEFWSRKCGAEALSLFRNAPSDEYYVHLAVPSNDWTYGPYSTRDAAAEKLTELRNERGEK